MLFWPEEQLYRLPRHEALLLQRGDRRGRVALVVWGRLQAVECAERAVDEGEGRGRSLDEKDIVIAADGAVECGELRGRDIGRVGGLELLALQRIREHACEDAPDAREWRKATGRGAYNDVRETPEEAIQCLCPALVVLD